MNIKPSCPTPSNLRIFKLSLLDQLIPQPYAPIVLFYLPNDNNYSDHCDQNDISNRLESLRKSLSSTLTRFYPLAGKFKDQLSIECNDEGANYVETQAVGFSLRQFLSHPGPDLLLVNVFDCGGIALGLCIAHKILDGVALSTFINLGPPRPKVSITRLGPISWRALLFPADDSLWLSDCSKAMFGSLFSKGKSITKRFVFNSSSISILKSQSASSDVENPTRVEAVSGFLVAMFCELGCSEGVDYMGVSSWCRIGFYEADLGGEGLYGLGELDEDDMAIVECNTQLLQLAQVDPSPLELD
ncbi:hypothetical protein F8388_007629 [Cannabis sativa]|uniref:Uncharacterized protein n=1 Tax=Cannabis sativa TaxID=3483 RepID=A0A7J6ET56_CANSA|nr:hypothetical protein F8388_007629 [Cannabis sativa]